jgi:hypothetical protein
MNKPFSLILVILILISVTGCQNNRQIFPVLKGPYLGQQPPGMQPTIFAPGIISDPKGFEWAGTFSPDGNEYYFWRTSENSQHHFLYTKVVNGEWTVPTQLASIAEYQAAEPHIPFDNQRLYFNWKHPVPPGQDGVPQYYFVERTQDGWSQPEYAGQGMFLSSNRDGELYTTDMSSRNSNGNTYLAKITTSDGLFVNYERLAIPAYSGYQAHPCIAPDGSYILFDVEGGSYLFVSFKNPDGSWGEAIDLTKHGFDPLAGGAYISPDGEYLFFALEDDIWWVDVKVIENLKP